jgi:hypothetical protein
MAALSKLQSGADAVVWPELKLGSRRDAVDKLHMFPYHALPLPTSRGDSTLDRAALERQRAR